MFPKIKCNTLFDDKILNRSSITPNFTNGRFPTCRKLTDILRFLPVGFVHLIRSVKRLALRLTLVDVLIKWLTKISDFFFKRFLDTCNSKPTLDWPQEKAQHQLVTRPQGPGFTRLPGRERLNLSKVSRLQSLDDVMTSDDHRLSWSIWDRGF